MDINNFASEKLKELRLKKNITQEELAEELNMTQQQIARYENGQRYFKQDLLFKLANYFNVSINDFFPPTTFDNGIQVDLTDTIKIPVFGIIKAGIPIESQTDIIDYVEIPKSWTNGGKQFYGLKISGDSMFPKYQEDDIVIFEKNDDKELYNGKDVAVMINGTESTFKKILVNDHGIVLQPYNTAYEIMMFNKVQVEKLPIRVVGIAREKRTKII